MKISVGNRTIPVIITPLIREKCDRPVDTGMPLTDLKQKYPDYEYLHFEREKWWTSDELPDGLHESFKMVRERVKKFKEFLYTRSEEHVYIVSHGLFIRTFLNQVLMNRNCEISYALLSNYKL